MKTIVFLVFSLLITGGYAANHNHPSKQQWSDVKSQQRASVVASLKLMPDYYRLLQMDETLVRSQLAPATVETQFKQRSSTTYVQRQLRVPLPDGQSLTLNLTQTDVMAPALAAKFPQIKTYRADASDNKGIYGTVDLGELGFHAMLFMANGKRLFIDPRQTDSGEIYYVSYFAEDYHPANKKAFYCQVKSHRHEPENQLAYRTAKRLGTQLKTYRLAMAVTSEYTDFFGGKTEAMSAIVSTVSRVNEIYQRDLAVKLQLVDNNDLLVQTDSSLYSTVNPDLMLEQNQEIVDRIIGSDNYDIAHVMSVGSGGLASLGSVCDNGYKAQGYTASHNPSGDNFDIDFVAHEMGHQLGATHTFNAQTGNCQGDNRTAETAYEPGSGSTIMAYAGICGRNDLQDNTDAMFHIASIIQISDYVDKQGGNRCGIRSSLTNHRPIANAGMDYSIPANTAFELVGSGSDPDKDSLTYSWEQIDSGTTSDVNVVKTDNAIFRAFLPVREPVRTFPKLSSILTNTTIKGEVLPNIARELNFSIVVRDGKGGVDADEMKVTVVDSNPFRISSHNATTTPPLKAGQTTDITWDVAGTLNAPVNCSQVDILLSTDIDHHFSTVLARKTANDGTETVTIPLNVDQSSVARIKVKCSDNIFFDISDADLTVKPLIRALTPVMSHLGGNQVADPGETIQLVVPLQNTSDKLITGVNATLSSNNERIEVIAGHSSYDDIQPTSSTDNVTPYTISIPASFACGESIPLTLESHFTADHSSTKAFEFTIPTGVSVQESKTMPVNQEIPDNNPTGLSKQISITDAVKITGTNFSIDVDIEHTYRGDIGLTLISPKGTSVILRKVSSSDFDKNLKGNFPQTLRPLESLQVLTGEDANGIWTLKISDSGEGDSGSLISWGIHFARATCSTNNVLPQAKDSQLTVEAGQVVNAQLQANDANDDTLTYQLETKGNKGTATITDVNTGAFTYTSTAGESGKDYITFSVSDAFGHSNIATVSIDITPLSVNSAPIANNDSASTQQDQTVTINVVKNDTDRDADTLIIINTTRPVHGVLHVINNQIKYTPEKGYSGTDEFTYTLSDGNGHRATATVVITIKEATMNSNRSPVAINGQLDVIQGVAMSGKMTANDSDNNSLIYSLVSKASKGVVNIIEPTTGLYVYTPHVNATGTDNFTFRVYDGEDFSNTATITIFIAKKFNVDNLVNNPVETSKKGGGGSLSWIFLGLMLLSGVIRGVVRRRVFS